MGEFRPLNESDLIKEIRTVTADTVVLVGNGALENGWLPLETVLKRWISEAPAHEYVKKLRVQNSEALHQLASLSYKFKIGRGLLYKQWVSGEMTPEQSEKAGLGSGLLDFLKIRDLVGGEYKKSSGELNLKQDDRIREMIGNDAVYITTNWDNALWEDREVKKAVYLHGRCEFPDSLVFPTELIIEDIAYDCGALLEHLSHCSEDFTSLMLRVFRCAAVEALLSAHSSASRHIHQAERLIIWGYSLGDFDADINALLGGQLGRGGKKELIVINTDLYAFQRAVALTGITSAWHYNPYLNSMLKLDV